MNPLLRKTDWTLLHLQKQTLTELLPHVSALHRENLEGLLNFLDTLQDEAEKRDLWNHPLSKE